MLGLSVENLIFNGVGTDVFGTIRRSNLRKSRKSEERWKLIRKLWLRCKKTIPSGKEPKKYCQSLTSSALIFPTRI
jgi:hypothetical protein